MNSKNDHIKDYLDYYCNLHNPPEFAVLIKGAWGSGKTWFLQQYMEQLKSENLDCLYTSLYGVSSFDAIEDDFFRQMHPLLKERDLHLTGTIVQHALKESIEIASDTELPPFLQNSDRHILFFDDLERCKLPIDELLGYLNDFVEHKGLKVIIALNEEEIGDRATYAKMKEKLIGKSFEITSDVSSALDHFINQLELTDLRGIFQRNTESITSTYHKTGYNNLRQLKQALMDVEHLYHLLPKKAQQLPELLKTMLDEHIAFSFELKNGSLAAEDLQQISRKAQLPSFEEIEPTNRQDDTTRFLEKYAHLDLASPVIGLSNIAAFFNTGFVNEEELETAINNSKFFIHENQKEWIKLWHYFDLSDDEFHKIFSQVQQNYMNKQYTKTNELLHIYGLFLELSSNNLYDIDTASIVEEAKEYIHQLKSENRLIWENQQESHADHHALHYHAADTREFKEIQDYLARIQKEALVEHMPQITHNLLMVMRTDSAKFWNLVSEPDAEYFDQIIFPYIDPESFVKHFTKVQDMRKTTAAIKQRYRPEFITDTHCKELEWLKKIRELLVIESKRRHGKLSAYVLVKCIQEGFDIAINRLEHAATCSY